MERITVVVHLLGSELLTDDLVAIASFLVAQEQFPALGVLVTTPLHSLPLHNPWIHSRALISFRLPSTPAGMRPL